MTMRLAEVLSADRVVVSLAASTLAEAASRLAETLGAHGGVLDPAKLGARLAELRAEDHVSLGDRGYVVHLRTDAVAELLIAIGVADAPIRRSADDAERPDAHVVVLVVAPPRQAARYLQVVGACTQVLSRAEHVAALREAGRAGGAHAVAAFAPLADVELPAELTVRDVMNPFPRTVRPEIPAREAAQELLRSRLGALPVVDDDRRLLGLLSERELMRDLLAQPVLGGRAARPAPGRAATSVVGRTVRDLMTRQVLCVAPEQPLAEVAALMTNKDVERIPVVREGRLVGYLTRGDVVRKLMAI